MELLLLEIRTRTVDTKIQGRVAPGRGIQVRTIPTSTLENRVRHGVEEVAVEHQRVVLEHFQGLHVVDHIVGVGILGRGSSRQDAR